MEFSSRDELYKFIREDGKIQKSDLPVKVGHNELLIDLHERYMVTKLPNTFNIPNTGLKQWNTATFLNLRSDKEVRDYLSLKSNPAPDFRNDINNPCEEFADIEGDKVVVRNSMSDILRRRQATQAELEQQEKYLASVEEINRKVHEFQDQYMGQPSEV
jgi:hypothetical protein